ncbi:Ribosomal protein S18 acetylase RimI [Klenkia marina]|uniref:Ribosomal protein S18 acetylase RimI n=1 Tax=Klenkia marina TaxID=1960309 RepID=A0A1G4YHZ5_9ACTN|nr:GNAT family N-acetyltransferase [Klenkia marina]SCX53130.1 Ribosomal protein S18 acetylase RimI [Klenkia marina]
MDLPRPLTPTTLVRRAVADDLPALVALLADDPMGRTREDPDDLAPYRRAFAEVDADPAHLLVVVEHTGAVVGTLQLSVLPSLAGQGARRAQLEAVRVHRDHRSAGLGSALVRWAVDEARDRGCALVQLTSDAQRPAAHAFYERLGFARSHVGFKLDLAPTARGITGTA